MIRIILADDHPVVREGLRAMLSAESDLEVVADASSGPQAEALAAELRPDIVLMDLRMPGGGGVDSIVRMTGAGLPCRVVVLTTYETDRDILRAVEAGAAGYLLKDLPRAELAEAVRAAARGETVLAPSVAARLVAAMHIWLIAVHRGVDGEDVSAARLRQVGCHRPDRGRHERDAVRAAGAMRKAPGVRRLPSVVCGVLSRAALPAPPRSRSRPPPSARRTPCP